MSQGLIRPHGGTLVNRIASDARAEALRAEARSLKRVNLTPKQSCDVEMIGIGSFSPLTGFMKKPDFDSVIKDMKLSSGETWPIPITLSVDKADAPKVGERVALYAPNGVLQAVMTIEEVYPHDRAKEATVFFNKPGDDDGKHPGAEAVKKEADTCLAGPIEVITVCVDPNGPEAFLNYRLTPAQTRADFEKRGWKTVVAFQTRNPIHRAHEYVCKCAQEICDGLLIHPLVGETKKGDIRASVRMQAIQALVHKYFNPATTALSVLPAAMRYAGPREAILHAIMRKNYGCSHFIVGRDHAGVGNYYGTYDAQKLFDQIDLVAFGIAPLKFEHTGYSKAYGGMVSAKTFPKIEGDIINLSGTAVRELLFKGERPPAEFSRPEVADILIAAAKDGSLFVE
ncbi:MAG: sulfate adenylyltransferase [Leptolyngbya sp. PLA3]|nr:MAG: sulfate adenylyltransferase [Cyanobacteria bacterium CYA]MCE7968904.1 sulfate adenylyltransferase [Leptolyngbya sp. PL-A3]